jgi:hypothetical protein
MASKWYGCKDGVRRRYLHTSALFSEDEITAINRAAKAEGLSVKQWLSKLLVGFAVHNAMEEQANG